MNYLANGAALLGRSGAMLGADDGFLRELGLPRSNFAAAWSERVREARGLGRGQAAPFDQVPAYLLGPNGAVALDCVSTPGGTLLVARGEGLRSLVEHALRSDVLTRVAAGVAHDIRNPLNAIALQTALLSEKLAAGDTANTASHLLALRDQVSRVNDILKRLGDVTEPAVPTGVDVHRVLADVLSLLGHEARRRRVTVTLSPWSGALRSAAPPERVGRLVLGLTGLALQKTAEGAALFAQVSKDDGDIVLSLSRPKEASNVGADGESGPPAALGPAISQEESDGRVTIELRLPAEVQG